MVAKIVVDQSAGKVLSYLIPEDLQNQVKIGMCVRVPLRTRVTQGIVVDISNAVGDTLRLRSICAVLNEAPLIQPVLIGLARWMANYYYCSLAAVLRCMLPSIVRKKVRRRPISEKERYVFSLSRKIDIDEFVLLKKKAPRQAELLLSLLNNPEKRLALTDVGDNKLERASTTTARSLEKRGLIRIETEQVQHNPFSNKVFLPTQAPTLSKEQEVALQEVVTYVREPENARPLLLYGITGSGKTEIYLGAIEETLRLGRTAMVLVPEISLTPQTVESLKSRFAAVQDQVVVIHSNLSKNERIDAWQKIHSKKARIVIGARSAIFSPLNNLGLIVVDEEHESSYKQEDSPRYHARDVAVLRATREKCAILLGSATPSLESFFNVHKGKYRLLRLEHRTDNCSLPIVRIVDLRKLKQPGRSTPTILSEPLRAAIQIRLDRREQIILFLNRRGFSTTTICTICGYVCKCPNCSLSMTYHRTGRGWLVCHLCGYTVPSPLQCPSCKDCSIRHIGIGTQKIEEIARQLFPTARIARVDADSMGHKKNAYSEILGLLKLGQIDLLIGTQIIAKGLHFPNVTLVGIVNADLSLYVTDFRAGERTFQLLTQVAGRTGRGQVQGEVLVQTFTPFSPYIQFACHHDYEGFFEQEIQFRKRCGHPPFCHLVLLILYSCFREHAESYAKRVVCKLATVLPPSVHLGRAIPAPLQKAKGKFRFHLTIRTRGIFVVLEALRFVLGKLPVPSDVALAVDVDPYQLL